MKHQVIHSPVAVGARSFPSGRSGTVYARWGKRAFDIALAVILLPVLLPVILALASVVALDGGAPFFGHRRVGKGGAGFAAGKSAPWWPMPKSTLPNISTKTPPLLRNGR